MEEFNKLLDHALIKVCNANHDDWDLKITKVLWSYHTTCKQLIGKTQFKLVYGQEEFMPMEYIILSLCITTMTGMDDASALEERAAQLIQLEEDHFIVGFQ